MFLADIFVLTAPTILSEKSANNKIIQLRNHSSHKTIISREQPFDPQGGSTMFFLFFFFISLTKFYSKIYFALKYAHTKNNNLTLHILTRKSDNVWRKKYRFFMSKKKKQII